MSKPGENQEGRSAEEISRSFLDLGEGEHMQVDFNEETDIFSDDNGGDEPFIQSNQEEDEQQNDNTLTEQQKAEQAAADKASQEAAAKAKELGGVSFADNGDLLNEKGEVVKTKSQIDEASDMSEEDLKKALFDDNGAPKIDKIGEIPAAEFAAQLGIKVEDGKDVTVDDIKAYVDKLKAFDSEEDPDVKDFKTFKALNPAATAVDFAQQFVSPFARLLALDNKALMFQFKIGKEGKDEETARTEVAKMEEDGVLDTQSDSLREKVKANDLAWTTERDKKVAAARAERNKIVDQNRMSLFTAMTENKDKFFGGRVQIKNTDIHVAMKSVNDGKTAKLLKDPVVYAEVALFLENKEKYLDFILAQGVEKGKGTVLEKLSEQSGDKDKARRSEQRKPAGSITPSEWT